MAPIPGLEFLANLNLTPLEFISWGYVIVFGIFILIATLIGFFRGFIRALSRLVCFVLSGAAALFVTVLLINKVGPNLFDTVRDLINLESISEQLAEAVAELQIASPTLTQYIPTIIICALGPIVFLAAFFLFAMITLFIDKLFAKLFGKLIKMERRSLMSRLMGMLVSGVSGFLLAALILMPVTGYAVNVSDVYKKLESRNVIAPASDEGETVADTIKGYDGLLPVKLEYLITSPVFKRSTSYTTESGVSSDLVSDVTAVSDVIPAVMDLQSMNFTDLENLDLTPLKGIFTALGNNKPMCSIMAEVFSYAGGKWINYEPFMGLNIKDQLPDDVKDSLDPVFEKLHATTAETVIDDLNSFIDEAEALASSYSSMARFSGNDFSDVGELNVAPLNAVIDAIEETTIVKGIVANLLSQAGEKWLNRETFLGVNIEEQLPDDLKGVFDPVYEAFAQTNEDNVVSQLKDIVAMFDDVSGVCKQIDVLSKEFENNDMGGVDVSPVRVAVDQLERSQSGLTRKIIASIVSKAGAEWLDGNEFMGINLKEKLPEDKKDKLDDVLLVMKNTTEQTVVDDLKSFADKIETIISACGYVEAFNAETPDMERMASALANVMFSINDDNKALVKELMDGAFNDFFDDEDTSSTLNDIMGLLIDEISGLTEEQKIASAKAVNCILNYLVDGEQIPRATAEEIIGALADSEAVGNVLKKYTEGEYGTITLTPEQKEAVSGAIDGYLAENQISADAELREVFDALKEILDI